MRLEAVTLDDGTMIQVEGERVDAAGAVDFKDQLRTLTDGGVGRVVLDLHRVTFIDSSGLGAIVGAMKALGGERRLELAGLTPAVERVFHLTRMDTVFRIHSDARSAGGRSRQLN